MTTKRPRPDIKKVQALLFQAAQAAEKSGLPTLQFLIGMVQEEAAALLHKQRYLADERLEGQRRRGEPSIEPPD